MHTPAPDPCALAPNLPGRLALAILHCLQKAPELRPQSAAEVSSELRASLEA